MKKILLIAGFAITLMSFRQAASIDDVVSALKTNDITAFNGYFDNSLDITLPERGEIKDIDKAQAGNTVKGFFDKSSIKGFSLTSQRAMGGTMYLTGKLTGGAKEYNITVMMKQKDSKVAIITVRIN